MRLAAPHTFGRWNVEAKTALWVLLAVAAAARLWGIDYGLPFVYWTDEYHEVMRAMELGAGGFNWARTGKGGFYLLLFAEYGVYYVLLTLAGAVSSTREFAELFVRDPTVFYSLGRITTAIFGVATVAMAACVGNAAYQARAGLLAGLFLAVNVLHVDLSHRVGVDIPMAMFATATLYFAVRIADGGTRKDYLFAALTAALATTTKLPGILLLVPLVIAHTYSVGRSAGQLKRWISSRDLWLAAAVFMSVWIATNPGILFAGNVLSLYAVPADEMVEEVSGTSNRPTLWIFYIDVLRQSMGWPLFGIAVGSVLYAAWRRRAADVMLLAYGLANYVAISATSSEYLYFPRYALPIVVVLSILAGRAICDALGQFNIRAIQPAAIVASVFIAWPTIQVISDNRVLTHTDTRTLAKEWFDANVPDGSKVLVEGGKISASRLSVPLIDSREALQRRIERWQVDEPRQARFLEVRGKVHPGGGYDLELVKMATIAPLEHYIEKNVEYYVIRPDSFLGSRKAKGGSAEFLKALREHKEAELVARFAGDNIRPGPTIEIYRVRDTLSSPSRT